MGTDTSGIAALGATLVGRFTRIGAPSRRSAGLGLTGVARSTALDFCSEGTVAFFAGGEPVSDVEDVVTCAGTLSEEGAAGLRTRLIPQNERASRDGVVLTRGVCDSGTATAGVRGFASGSRVADANSTFGAATGGLA